MKAKSFSEWVMKVVLLQSMLMLWASYFLAYCGRNPVEGLSKIVAAEIVITCLGFFAKKGVENISKHNVNWPCKRDM